MEGKHICEFSEELKELTEKYGIVDVVFVGVDFNDEEYTVGGYGDQKGPSLSNRKRGLRLISLLQERIFLFFLKANTGIGGS